MSTTEVKYTPGPWKADGTRVVANKKAVALVVSLAEYAHPDTYLIAAAPELLEALEQAHTLLGELLIDNVLGEDVIPVHDAMMAAIRKAKGE
jgi:hypothetical protein